MIFSSEMYTLWWEAIKSPAPSTTFMRYQSFPTPWLLLNTEVVMGVLNVLFTLNRTTHSSVLLLCMAWFNVNKTLFSINSFNIREMRPFYKAINSITKMTFFPLVGISKKDLCGICRYENETLSQIFHPYILFWANKGRLNHSHIMGQVKKVDSIAWL